MKQFKTSNDYMFRYYYSDSNYFCVQVSYKSKSESDFKVINMCFIHSLREDMIEDLFISIKKFIERKDLLSAELNAIIASSIINESIFGV